MTTPTNDLGAFSVSLAVKDLAASRAFYEALGFVTDGCGADHGYVMMRHGPTVIGLFQGMFEANILTFNPGWSADAQAIDGFTDVRALQRRFVAAGLTPTLRADESTTGPAHLLLVDPDGNTLMFDQHV